MTKTRNKGLIFRDSARLRKTVATLAVSRVKRKRTMSWKELDKTIEDIILS